MLNWPTSDSTIVDAIIGTEGDFSNNPQDSGGATRFGVTQITLAEWRKHPVTVQDVENLTQAEAREIYRDRYINKPGFASIGDLRLKYLLVDTAILFGPERAVIMAQKALGLKQDGNCGPLTLQAINSYKVPQKLVNAIACERVLAHAERCQQNHSEVVFLVGWTRRGIQFIE